jgi:hypothetical protein
VAPEHFVLCSIDKWTIENAAESTGNVMLLELHGISFTSPSSVSLFILSNCVF